MLTPNIPEHIPALVQEMIQLLREAAQQEVLPRFGKVTGQPKGNPKGFLDIVTAADISASQYILERIRKTLPGSYSEEHKYPDRFEHDLIWQIDPVDGTDEFCAQDTLGYTMLATLLQKHQTSYKPIATIIYRPGDDSTWFYDGDQVRWLERGTEHPLPALITDQLIGIVRKSDPSERLIAWYQQVGKTLNLPVTIHYGGGAGASFADMLAGKANLYVMNFNYSKEWDIAPAEPIFKQLGGWVCSLTGEAFTYNRPDVAGLGEPYNLNGWITSYGLAKERIMPYVGTDLLIDRLKEKLVH